MNNIVLYKAIIIIGFVVLSISLSAQNPSIDLIPSSRQIMQHAAVIDTSSTLDSLVQKTINSWTPDVLEKNASREIAKKERRQIGPSIDSLLRKSESKKEASSNVKGNISLYIRKFNPILIFIRITALK